MSRFPRRSFALSLVLATLSAAALACQVEDEDEGATEELEGLLEWTEENFQLSIQLPPPAPDDAAYRAALAEHQRLSAADPLTALSGAAPPPALVHEPPAAPSPTFDLVVAVPPALAPAQLEARLHDAGFVVLRRQDDLVRVRAVAPTERDAALAALARVELAEVAPPPPAVDRLTAAPSR